MTAPNALNISGEQLINGALAVNEIGNHFAAQYVEPVPPGPEAHYSLWNSTSNSWQTPSQVDPTPQIVPTVLADANYPVWDVVAATLSPGGTQIFPNGIADSIFQVRLTVQQDLHKPSPHRREITGIAVTVDKTLWGVGQYSDGSAIGGYQVGVILGETVINSSQLAFASGATLLNSTNPGLDHWVMGETETLNLFIDRTNTAPFSGTPLVTVYFKDGHTDTPSVLAIPNQGGTVAANSTDYLDTQVLGIATVTETNDSSLANIDSGFVINTDNTVLGSILASGFNANGSLAYVAMGNRGYTDNQGNLVEGGTVQILLASGKVLQGAESNLLTTTNLLGNPVVI